MKFPSITAKLLLDPASTNETEWRLAVPLRDPLSDKAFARHVARQHYTEIAELSVRLERTFFYKLEENNLPRSRSRYIEALGLATFYLSRQGLPNSVTVELLKLIEGLRELDEGVTRPFLKQAAVGKRGRRTLPSGVWEARAFIVMALDHMVEHADADVEKAAARIAKDTAYLGPAIRGRANNYDGSLILEWHTAFANKTVSSKSAQHLYDSRKELTEAYRLAGKTNDPRAIAENMFQEAALHAVRELDENSLAETLKILRRNRSLN